MSSEPTKRRPTLYSFHLILMAVTVAFGTLLSVWGWLAYRSSGGMKVLSMAAGSAFVTLAVLVYLVRFVGKIGTKKEESPR